VKARVVVRIVAAAIACVAFAWVATRLDWRELGQRMAGASIGYLALMALAWIVAFLPRSWRLRYLIGSFGHVQKRDYRTIWTAMVFGMTVNSFAPMRAGDAVLAVFLRQKLGVSLHHGLAVIMVDWLCDFICVVVIFLGALPFAPVVAAWTDRAVVIIVSVLAIAFTGLWILKRFRALIVVLLDRVLSRILPRQREYLVKFANELLQNLSSISSWRIATPLGLVSALIWGLTAASYCFGLRAVYPEVTMAAGPFTAAAIALGFVVPLGPAGLGAFEAASVLALAVFGVPLEAAIAFAIIAHVFQLGVVLTFALMAVLTRRLDYRSLRAAP
jgi:uncharacterized protein (TIRG00374 family)